MEYAVAGANNSPHFTLFTLPHTHTVVVVYDDYTATLKLEHTTHHYAAICYIEACCAI
jgi:hypothetical protein